LQHSIKYSLAKRIQGNSSSSSMMEAATVWDALITQRRLFAKQNEHAGAI